MNKGPTPLKGGPDAIKKPTTKVLGNYFCPEMRTVCALLELNEI